MTMNGIASSLDPWEGLKNCIFKALRFFKHYVFYEHLPPKDGAIDESHNKLFWRFQLKVQHIQLVFWKCFENIQNQSSIFRLLK